MLRSRPRTRSAPHPQHWAPPSWEAYAWSGCDFDREVGAGGSARNEQDRREEDDERRVKGRGAGDISIPPPFANWDLRQNKEKDDELIKLSVMVAFAAAIFWHCRPIEGPSSLSRAEVRS